MGHQHYQHFLAVVLKSVCRVGNIARNHIKGRQIKLVHFHPVKSIQPVNNHTAVFNLHAFDTLGILEIKAVVEISISKVAVSFPLTADKGTGVKPYIFKDAID